MLYRIEVVCMVWLLQEQMEVLNVVIDRLKMKGVGELRRRLVLTSINMSINHPVNWFTCELESYTHGVELRAFATRSGS